MRFLGVSDRKEAALVNRTWYAASLDPCLQKDVIFNFDAISKDQKLVGVHQRRIQNLHITEVDNDVGGTGPQRLGNLIDNLESVSFKSSNITGNAFMSFVSSCQQIGSLDLSGCNSMFMTGTLLQNESDRALVKNSLQSVQRINLSGIRFLSDSTFNRMMDVCGKVKHLSLASTQITLNSGSYCMNGVKGHDNTALVTFDNILTYIKKCCMDIESLDFSTTTINNDALKSLSKVKGLELRSLALSGCRDISDVGISDLCKSQPTIRHLDVSGCPEIGNLAVSVICTELGNVLQTLKIAKCKQINDYSASQIKSLKQLRYLDLTECYQVTSSGLNAGLCSQPLPYVSVLNLSCCSYITDEFVIKLCERLPQLANISLNSCFSLTDKSIIAISSHLKYLRSLSMCWCREISDVGILGKEIKGETDWPPLDITDDHSTCRCSRHRQPEFFKHKQVKASTEFVDIPDDSFMLNNLAGLTSLFLSSCAKLTDIGITQAIRFKELRQLSLGAVHCITDKSVISIATHNPSLEELDISQCAAITDDAVGVLSKKLPRLTSLDIYGCDSLTDKSVGHLHGCTRLKHLNVNFCMNVTPVALDSLQNALPYLQIVRTRLLGMKAVVNR